MHCWIDMARVERRRKSQNCEQRALPWVSSSPSPSFRAPLVGLGWAGLSQSGAEGSLFELVVMDDDDGWIQSINARQEEVGSAEERERRDSSGERERERESQFEWRMALRRHIRTEMGRKPWSSSWCCA